MNKDRMEVLLEAAKLCQAVSDVEMSKETPDLAFVCGAAECGHRLDMLLAKEAGLVRS